MKVALPILFLILLIVGHAVGPMLTDAPKEVEESLVTEAQTALLENGVTKSQVQVAADHRDVHLSGEVPGSNIEEVKELVRKALSTGKARLTSEVAAEPAIAAPTNLGDPTLALKRRNGLIEVSGKVPSEDIRKEIISVVETMEPDTPVEGALTVEPNLAEPGWLTKFGYWWPRILQINPQAEFGYGKNTFQLTGPADDAGQIKAARGALTEVFANNIKLDLSGFTPPLSPPVLALNRNANGKATIGGELPNDATRNRILKALNQAEPGLDLANQTKVGEFLSEPDWVKNFGKWWPILQKEVPNASFSIVNNELQIFGEGATPDSRGKLPNLLLSHLGDGFSIDAQEVQAPKMIAPDLKIQRTGDLIAVNGNIPAKAEKDLLAALQQNGQKVESKALKTGPNYTSPDWLTKFGSWWPQALKQVPDAVVEVEGSNFSLKGSAAEIDSESEVRKLIRSTDAALAKNAKLSIDPLGFPELLVVGNRSGLTLEGTMGSPTERTTLLNGFSELGGEVKADQLKPGSRVRKVDWSSSLGSYMSSLVKEMESVELQINGQKASIKGQIAEAKQKKQIVDNLKVVLGNDYTVTESLDVKPVEVAMNNKPRPEPEEMKPTKPATETKEMTTAVDTTPKPEEMKKPEVVEPKKEEPKPLVSGDLPKETFYFGKNSSYLPAEEKEKLSKFAEQLKGKDYRIVLIGHADYRGDQEYNVWLSDRRAKRVLDGLKSHGFNGNSNTEIRALGEANAASAKEGEAAWRKDRRVDVLIQAK